MAYEPANTAARLIAGTPIMVEGLNVRPLDAFHCAEAYLARLRRLDIELQWLRGIWFTKYRFQPGLVVVGVTTTSQPAPVAPPDPALAEYYCDRIRDQVQPFVFALAL